MLIYATKSMADSIMDLLPSKPLWMKYATDNLTISAVPHLIFNTTRERLYTINILTH